jgi:hypothetical protein
VRVISARLIVFAIALPFAALQGAAAQGLQPLEVAASRTVLYFIAAPSAATSARPDDRELAEWALATWESELGGTVEFAPVEDEDTAQVRLYWAAAAGGQYGEMRPIDAGGRRGAAVFVRPDVEGLGPEVATRAGLDPLFRDSIVYLTCLHELGHALGLAHTANFEDIMYAFGYGGDIPAYFGRFRRQLTRRADIPSASVLSAGDLAELRRLYAAAGEVTARPN